MRTILGRMEGMEIGHFRELCAYIGLGADEMVILREALPVVRPSFGEVVDEFYDAILANPRTRAILEDEQQVERLKQTLRVWLEDLFSSERDEAYLARRSQVGKTHVRIGLAQVYVFAAMGLIRDKLLRFVSIHVPAPDRALPIRNVINKALDVELAVLADGYMEADKFRDLVENAPEMIHSVDAAGRFVDVNRTEQRLLGYEASELLRMRIHDIVPPEHHGELSRHLERVFQKGFSTLVTRFRTRDGRLLDVEISASGQVDRVTGKVVRTRAYVRDITERRRLERILQHKERLAAVGEMAVALAHEVRNPLSGISGAIQVLARKEKPPSPNHALYAEIQTQIQRLNRLVEDLLHFGRPITPRVEPAPLGPLLQRAYAILKESPDFGSVRLSIGGEAQSVPAAVDTSLFQQVIFNLFLNAAQAMRGAGEIRILISREPDHVLLRIEDTGPGIPPTVAGDIFKPFFTTKPQGSGLGLPICQRIVEAHGGRLEVKADGSPGAEFRIRVPLSSTSR